jgi:predicted adenylyl cyclase CyaB
MAKEVELKFMDIDKDEMIKKILALGAIKKYETTLENVGFDGPGFSRNSSQENYLRIRKINDDAFLTFKGPAENSHLKIREEHEVKVSDYEETVKIFEAMGLTAFRFTKNRTHFELDDIHFEIDEWGFIDPFLEIEAPEEQMEGVCQRLGLDIKEGRNQIITEIYPEKFK